MEVGYLPDMFGHVGQMPQLLREAGFADAVVWRGVPSVVDKTAFWWASPDGSVVRAEYLPGGYSTGASLGDDAKALVRRLEAFEQENSGFLIGPDAAILFPNGGDHQEPQPWLGRVVAEANAIQDRFEIVISSLPDALAGAPRSGLPSWQGELRSGARANVLMGVASNRVDVKQAAARAERALERLAEPLAALLMAPDRYPEVMLRIAWRELVRNSLTTRSAPARTTRSAPPCSTATPRRRGSRGCHRARPRPPRLIVVGALPRRGEPVLEVSFGSRRAGHRRARAHRGRADPRRAVRARADLVLTTTEVSSVLSQFGGQDQLGEGAYLAGVDVEEDDTASTSSSVSARSARTICKSNR